jgi:predicted AAA+ superfamily ATPase
LLRRVFELGCQYSGQIVSLTKILGSLQDKGNTTTLSHYLLLLEQAGLLAGLEKYSPDQARRRAAPPKFQVFNNALMSALSGKGFQEVQDDHALWGRWVESAVGAHLLNKALQGRDELQYWRDGKNEVDFIYTHRNERTAIEVKSQPTHRSPGLEAFVGRYHPEKIVLVGHEGMRWEDYLLT